MDKSFCVQFSTDNKSNVPPLAFNCSYASSVINKNAESTYNLRNPEQLAIFACCGIRKKNKCAYKTYVTGICMRNPLKIFLWNPLTFWNIFQDLSLESRNIQTQNCAPIQCKVWPRNAKKKLGNCLNF